jgi:hypothetical protein
MRDRRIYKMNIFPYTREQLAHVAKFTENGVLRETPPKVPIRLYTTVLSQNPTCTNESRKTY